MPIIQVIIITLYYLLPAAVANMFAAISNKMFPHWTYPMDFGKSFRGKRILGENKTIRGLIVGTLFGFAIYILQDYLYTIPLFKSISMINYSETTPLLGLTLSAGALFGDAAKSFFKRQFNRPPGKAWFPYDQINWSAGALILSSLIINYPTAFILLSLLITLITHILVKAIGYVLKLDKELF